LFFPFSRSPGLPCRRRATSSSWMGKSFFLSLRDIEFFLSSPSPGPFRKGPVAVSFFGGPLRLFSYCNQLTQRTSSALSRPTTFYPHASGVRTFFSLPFSLKVFLFPLADPSPPFPALHRLQRDSFFRREQPRPLPCNDGQVFFSPTSYEILLRRPFPCFRPRRTRL